MKIEPIKVYSINNGMLIEDTCEVYGYPNYTHKMDKMYDNQEYDKMSIEDRSNMATKCGLDLRKLMASSPFENVLIRFTRFVLSITLVPIKLTISSSSIRATKFIGRICSNFK